MKKSSSRNRTKTRRYMLKLFGETVITVGYGLKAGKLRKTFPKVRVQKLEPKPNPDKVYDKPKVSIDRTGMRFIKSKNIWKNESEISITAVSGMTNFQVRCSKRINKLSPKEKRAAWRNAHNTRPKKKAA